MTVGKVLDYFVKYYNEALHEPMIEKPMSYALYQTWKWLDSIEKPKSEKIPRMGIIDIREGRKT